MNCQVFSGKLFSLLLSTTVYDNTYALLHAEEVIS